MPTEIPVSEIKAFLDRQSPKEEFEWLKQSIRQDGVQVPIQVTEIDSPKQHKKKGKFRYQLVWGHRRLRAAKEIGLKTIPAEIVSIDSKERVKRFFIENEARKQLTAYEVAQLMEADYGELTLDEIAEKYCMKRGTVRDILRALENATSALRKQLNAGRFTLEDARAITQISDPREQTLIINRAIEKGLRGYLLKKEVRSIKRIDSISTRSLQAQQRALKLELRKVSEEREKVTEKYMNSVSTLQDALDFKEIRDLMNKNKIEFSQFWSE